MSNPPILGGGQFVSDGQFQFTINAAVGTHVKVYSSSDLANWTRRDKRRLKLRLRFLRIASLAASIIACIELMTAHAVSEAIGFSRTSVAQPAMIANQFDAPPNTLNSLLPNVPPGTQLYKWMGGSSTAYTFDDIDFVWEPNDSGATLAPGEGGFIHNSSSQAIPIVFIGTVKQGTLPDPIGASTWLKSSIVPQAGGLTSVLGYQPSPGDEVFLYRNGGYTTYIFDDVDLAWTPSEPVLNVGECFRITHNTSVNWTRNFSPCP